MKHYLFCFGYQTPDQIGLDEEDSTCLYIKAHNKEEAHSWGLKVAEKFVDHLNTLHLGGTVEKWFPENYAHWIEEDEKGFLSGSDWKPPSVAAGDYPDFEFLSSEEAGDD